MRNNHQKYINTDKLMKIKMKKKQYLPINYENNRYILFFSFKILNYPLNLSIKIRNLIYLINIKLKKY